MNVIPVLGNGFAYYLPVLLVVIVIGNSKCDV
jgi:hypothetical protein